MVWPWYAFIACCVLAVVAVVLWRRWGNWDREFYGMLAAVGLGMGILIFGVMGLSISVGRHYDRQGCRQFADQTQRETKFVIYTTFSWDCLTPTGEGKWISTDNLREFGDAQ